MSETHELHVTGMTCGGCENAVRRAVGKLPGVTSVTASHQAQRVEVTFDPSRIDLDAIRRQITTLGYVVTE